MSQVMQLLSELDKEDLQEFVTSTDPHSVACVIATGYKNWLHTGDEEVKAVVSYTLSIATPLIVLQFSKSGYKDLFQFALDNELYEVCLLFQEAIK